MSRVPLLDTPIALGSLTIPGRVAAAVLDTRPPVCVVAVYVPSRDRSVTRADTDEAVDDLARTGPAAPPSTRWPAVNARPLDAVRATLANHVGPHGIHLGAAIWIITANNPT